MNKLKRLQTVILLMLAVVLFLMMPYLSAAQLGFPWISRLAFASELTPAPTQKLTEVEHLTQTHLASPTSANTTSSVELQKSPASYRPDVTFQLETSIGEGKFIFSGVGNKINGIANPDLKIKIGEIVQLILVNGDGAEHDIALPDFNTYSDTVVAKGASSVIVFRADKQGVFPYFCTIPGHRQAGMEGRLIVMGKDETQKATSSLTSIVRNPTDLPKPISERLPQLVRVNLEAVELQGKLAPDTTYNYWTFNGKVPGPFIRVRQDDTVELHLKNSADNRMIHSIDLHAVTGPGGGAIFTQVSPGQEKVFTFKALKPGLFVYHCATPMVSHHIANGLYGLILVEPTGGLMPVDREFYLMQGEIYTVKPSNQPGPNEFSVDKLLVEQPEYFVFNGAVGAITTEYPLQAKVGETVRLYFGVGGPNHASSFHVIGEIMDRVYDQASLSSPPKTNVQTTLVPPGGATVVEFQLDVPGRYTLVDHALSRLERGLVGYLVAQGQPHPEIFHQDAAHKLE